MKWYVINGLYLCRLCIIKIKQVFFLWIIRYFHFYDFITVSILNSGKRKKKMLSLVAICVLLILWIDLNKPLWVFTSFSLNQKKKQTNKQKIKFKVSFCNLISKTKTKKKKIWIKTQIVFYHMQFIKFIEVIKYQIDNSSIAHWLLSYLFIKFVFMYKFVWFFFRPVCIRYLIPYLEATSAISTT